MASLAHITNPVRQADVIAHATVALDGRENAMHWLQTTHPALNGRTPLDAVFTGSVDELELVDQLLSALEYGVYT